LKRSTSFSEPITAPYFFPHFAVCLYLTEIVGLIFLVTSPLQINSSPTHPCQADIYTFEVARVPRLKQKKRATDVLREKLVHRITFWSDKIKMRFFCGTFFLLAPEEKMFFTEISALVSAQFRI